MATTTVFLTLLLFSIDRYYALLENVRLPVKVVKIVFVAIWVSSLCINVPFAMMSGGIADFLISNASNESALPQHMNRTEAADKIYRATHIATLFIYAVITIIVLYALCRMAYVVYCLQKEEERQEKLCTLKTNSFKLLSVIIMLSYMFSLPYWLTTAFNVKDKGKSTIKPKLQLFLYGLACARASVVPFTCIILSSSYRASIKRTLRKLLCRKGNYDFSDSGTSHLLRDQEGPGKKCESLYPITYEEFVRNGSCTADDVDRPSTKNKKNRVVMVDNQNGNNNEFYEESTNEKEVLFKDTPF